MDVSLNHNQTSLSALLIAYGRPKNTRAILNVLSSSGVAKVYVSIDGPKNATIESLQCEIFEIIDECSSEQFEIIVRRHPTNLGVGLGVIAAVDWFFTHCESGFIIEDDLVISPNFIQYGNWAISQLANQPKCLFAGGFFINKSSFVPKGPFLCRYPMIWGWVTTGDKWSIMKELILRPKHFSIAQLFSMRDQYWFVGAKRASLGIVDTWDTQLTYEFLRLGYSCILPNVPLIQNIGFDEIATHAFDQNPLLMMELDKECNFDNSVVVEDFESSLSYHKFLEEDLYGISFRNFFSVYKLAIQSLFFKKKSYVTPLYEREKSLLTHES